MPLIGPKLSGFLMAMSAWGIVMLALMGVFSRVNAVAFIEDIPLDEQEWAKQNYSRTLVENAYVTLSNNCFIAAGIYVAILAFSGLQFYFNSRLSFTQP